MANAYVVSLVLILAAISAISLATAEGEGTRKPYVVHMLKSAKPHHFTSHQRWYASMLDQFSQSGELLYTYHTVLHGFAATLSGAEAEAMESMDGCLAVIPSSIHQVDTTHSPEFLSLAGPSGVWSKYSNYSKDVIVGVIDTGVWPESKSFSDAGLGPVPARWKGICQFGQKFNSSNCNKKIIGARYYFKSYEKKYNISIDPISEYKSARDSEGHGTHVASTVAGAPLDVSNWFGNGKARGMSPQARLAIYKACWKKGCAEADTTAAIDQAIADGVDIISISIGSPDLPFYESTRAIAEFGAIKHGVFVSAPGGNSGPFSSTLGNTLPWTTTVGASSIDRDFHAFVRLNNGVIYRGISTYKGGDGKLHRPFSLVYASATSSAKRCLNGSLDPNVVKGKIVLCDQLLTPKNRDENGALGKGEEVARAGGVGLIVANEVHLGAEQRITEFHKQPSNSLPSMTVSFRAGEIIKSYTISQLNNATAAMNITGSTVVGKEITAPMVAALSSRGPSKAYPLILKPDLIAPGVNILAAVGDGYEFHSGTSIACPHVSGIAALIKAVHTKWSPAAIKSALMTSSYILDNAKQPIKDANTMQAAGPFSMGAGHIDPEAAVDPGLVYDLEPQDYINFLCSLNYTKQQLAPLTNATCPNEATDLNYPSFSVVFKSGQPVQVKTRTLTYVGSALDAEYSVSVRSPSGVKISVEPEQLNFRTLNEKAEYSVRFENEGTAKAGTVGSGEITWISFNGGKHIVRSPIVVVFQSSILSLDHSVSNITYTFGLLSVE